MGDDDHPSYIKGQTYQLIEKLVAQDVAVTREQLETFIELLNKDLPRKANGQRLLNIFDIVLDKMQNNLFPIVPQIRSSMPLVMNYLIDELEQPNINIKILTNLTETLIRFSAEFYPISRSSLFDPMINVLELCFKKSELNHQHLANILKVFESFLKNLSKQDRVKFVELGVPVWLKYMIPFIFLKENKERQFGLTVFDSIINNLITLKYTNSPEWQTIMKSITDSKAYPDVMMTLLKRNDPLWEQLWICILKITGTELHKIGGLINPLLFVIQEGFKSSIDFKIKSFNCLKELISNYTLDVNILHNTKRIQVITIALESNNAKTNGIAIVKYKTWWYFISKLGQDVIKYEKVVNLFFKFCFGELNIADSSSSACPGKVFLPLQNIIIKTFIELCGHRKSCKCLKNPDFRLQPIISSIAVDKYRNQVLNSLKQISIYVHTQMGICNKEHIHEYIQILRCTWSSVMFSASKIISAEANKLFLSSLFDLVGHMIEKLATDVIFADIILTVIIPSIIIKDGYSIDYLNQDKFKYSNQYTPIQALICLISKPILYHNDNISKMLECFEDVIKVGLQYDTYRFSDWIISQIESTNSGTLLWCALARALSNQNNVVNVMSKNVLLWPLLKLDLKDSNSMLLSVLESWKKLYNIQNKMKLGIVKTKDLKEEIYAAIDKESRGFFATLLPGIIINQAEEAPGDLSSFERPLQLMLKHLSMFESGTLSDSQLSILMNFLKDLGIIAELYCHSLMSSRSTDILSVVIKVINIFIIHYKGCTVQQFTEDVKASMYVCLLLDNLGFLQSPTYFSKIASRVVILICTILKVYKHFPNIETKCCNILNLLLKNKSKIKLENYEIVNIKQTLNSVKKVDVKIFQEVKKPANDDDFVVIKPNWKFDPKNLTEHQIDALKRRRDDIPALHEDLSQSQDEFSLQVWKLPGYNSEDSTKSSDKNVTPHISERIVKMINNCNSKDSELLAIQPVAVSSPPVTQSKMIDPSKRTAQLIKMCTPESKENCLKVEEKDFNDKVRDHSTVMKESNGILQSGEKVVSAESPTTTRKNKSILSRLHDNINKTLKGSCKDESEEVIMKEINAGNPDALIETSVEVTIPETVKTQMIEDKQAGPQIDINDKVETQPMDVDVNNEKSEIPVNTEINDIVTKNTSKRPVRAKRKTSKLLASEEVGSVKKTRRRNSIATVNLEKKTEINFDDLDLNLEPNIKNAGKDESSQIQLSNKDDLSNKDNKSSTPNIGKSKNRSSNLDKEKRSQIQSNDADKKQDSPLNTYDEVQDKNSQQNLKIPKSSQIQLSNNDDLNNKDNRSSTPNIGKYKNRNLNLDKEKRSQIQSNDADKKQDSPLNTNDEVQDKNSEQNLKVPKSSQIQLSNKDDLNNKDNRNSTPNIGKSKNRNLNLDKEKRSQIQSNDADKKQDSPLNTYDEVQDKNSEQNLKVPKNKISKLKLSNVDQDQNSQNTNDKLDKDLQTNLENVDLLINIDQNNDAKTKPVDIVEIHKTDKLDKVNLNLNSNNAEIVSSVEQNSQPNEDIRKDDEDKNQNFQPKSNKCKIIKRRHTIAEASTDLSNEQLKKKKNNSRLMRQLQIETTEGHPIIMNYSKTRCTRRTTSEFMGKSVTCVKLDDANSLYKNIFSQETEDTSLNTNTESSQDVIGSSQEDSVLFQAVLAKNKSNVSVKEMSTEEIAEAETEPFIETLNESIKLNTSIVSSPCIKLDDERTLEFLNDTVDISPIKVSTSFNESSSPPKITVIPQSKDLDLKATSPESIINERVISPVKTSPPKSKKPNVQNTKPVKSNWTSMVNSRTAQMLSQCMQNDVICQDSDLGSSPLKSTENTQLLGFTKDLSSAMDSPVGPSILKRKLEADEFGLSPASKKKRRVSFHDPPVSTTMSVERYLKPYSLEDDPPIKPERPKRSNNVAKCLMNKIENQASESSSETIIDTDSQLSEVCSLQLDSPSPLNIITNHLLDDINPIYPNLIDCQDSISVISADLSSPMWKDDFLKELKGQITTVGDLAKLSELEVNRLPIKTPKVLTALKVMEDYHVLISNNVASEVMEGLSETQFKSTIGIEESSGQNSTIDTDVTVCEEADFKKMLDNIPVNVLKDYVYDKIECDLSFKDQFKDLVRGIANRKKLELLRDSMLNMLSNIDSE